MHMKNLIKIQAIINQLEELRLRQVEYRSQFEYEDNNNMVVTTYCSNWTMTIKMMFDGVQNVCSYLEGNDKIRFIDIEREV